MMGLSYKTFLELIRFSRTWKNETKTKAKLRGCKEKFSNAFDNDNISLRVCACIHFL